MKHTVLKALQPKKYFELLLEKEKTRLNARDLGNHRFLTVSHCEGPTVSVNLDGTIILLTLAIVPNKNIMDIEPKIELSITGVETMHKEYLTQLINETISVTYKPDLSSKVKLIIVAHIVCNNGNIETAISFGLPQLVARFTDDWENKMSDQDSPVSLEIVQQWKTIKVGLIFKDKIWRKDNLYIIVDPDKDEEEKFIDIEILASFVKKGKEFKWVLWI